MWLFYIISAACGISVACAEIISRYKAEPLKALSCKWSYAYLVFNMLLAVVALAILHAADTVSSTMAIIDNLKYSLAAGFGSAIVMRSKISNAKLSSGEQISIGPDFVIDTFLNVLDRQIDRKRALRRLQMVRETLVGVDYEKAKMPTVTLLQRSMQNISKSEQENIATNLALLDNTDIMSNQDKTYALGFLVLDLSGEEFFKEVFNDTIKKTYLVDDTS